MAMLMTNGSSPQTWADTSRCASRPSEFWPDGDRRAAHADHPDTVLIAEAYWDMEWELQQQGFDFCYDKRLYDRIAGAGRDRGPRAPAAPTSNYQSRLLRFLENHDEPRIAARLPVRSRDGPRRSRSRRCPVQRCGTKDSSRADASGHRSSCRGGRTSRRTTNSPPGTGGC